MFEICNVGYILSASKLKRLGIQNIPCDAVGKLDCLQDMHNCGVAFFPFNADTARTMNFHIIIHKLTDLEAEQSISTMILIENYLAKQPKCVIIDSLCSIRKATSRFRACECLGHILQKAQVCSMPFTQPAYCMITNREEFMQKMQAFQIVFPVICKPIDACGIPGSHEMVVLVSEADLSLLSNYPCLLQQYYNHDGKFYKVYVMDGEVFVHQRRSLPNIAAENSESSVSARKMRSVHFDSRNYFPTWTDFHVCSDESNLTPSSSSIELDVVIASAIIEKCKEAAILIEKEFELTLFGFDVIIPTGTNITQDDWKLIVIDVNFYPSYKEVVDFPQILRKLLRRKADLDPYVEEKRTPQSLE